MIWATKKSKIAIKHMSDLDFSFDTYYYMHRGKITYKWHLILKFILEANHESGIPIAIYHD